MPATFVQTTRALEADRPRAVLTALAVGLPLLVAWAVWFFVAEVAVHEATDAGRVEVAQTAHDVDAPVAGRVVASNLVLGADVKAGDVLVELDAETERRRLSEEKTRLATIEPELEAKRRQLAAIEQTGVSDRATTVTELAQARARRAEAEAIRRQASEEARRAEQLHKSGAISEMELLRARTEAARQRAARDAVSLELARLEGSQRTRDVQGQGRGEELKSEMAALEGQKERTGAAIAVLEQEITQRTIRAGVTGRLGEMGKIGVGQFVKVGDRLGSIVPSGGLRAVADFPPEAALGRIRSGQLARLRMQGFPWTQYGVIDATVTNVANELRDGKVRVELSIHPSPSSKIPLGHGMPGSVEVDVERTSPAHLVFRAAGKLLGKPVPARTSAE